MRTKENLLSKILKRGLSPIKKVSVSEWADEYRQLPSDSAEPGRWHTSRVPYMKEIMDAFTDTKTHRVVVKAASQLGKALDIETLIPTPRGFCKMEDLYEGDWVIALRIQ